MSAWQQRRSPAVLSDRCGVVGGLERGGQARQRQRRRVRQDEAEAGDDDEKGRQDARQTDPTIEHHELQREELKASNEELQAMNEELRSASEELETGKEELQSVNEELVTILGGACTLDAQCPAGERCGGEAAAGDRAAHGGAGRALHAGLAAAL